MDQVGCAVLRWRFLVQRKLTCKPFFGLFQSFSQVRDIGL